MKLILHALSAFMGYPVKEDFVFVTAIIVTTMVVLTAFFYWISYRDN